MSAILHFLLNHAAPIFLVSAPVTSYADQILSMHRTRSSAGFSLDIPLIMLTASILKVFYWPGARFDRALLLQALVMIAVQSVLLKVALDNRPTPLRIQGIEMKSLNGGASGMQGSNMRSPAFEAQQQQQQNSWRPYNFWRWRETQPYWNYLLLLTLALVAFHVLLHPSPTNAEGYTSLLGALGLGIEAILPIPQMWTNYSKQSCKGFRLSVLANWLFGDAMKMAFFFLSEPGKIPLAFKACGIFQAACDFGLGMQYWMYGEGIPEEGDEHLA